MKRPLFITLFFAAVLAFSCSNDFDVIAKWKDIPVVYGLLDISDTAHYIRVEKAFLDPSGDATVLAKEVDSLYYQNATVKLERVSNGELFTLQKVDGNKWGYPRKPGVFATEPNWIYRIDSTVLRLKSGEVIKLHIDRGNGQADVTSQARILAPIKLNNPSGSSAGFGFRINQKTNIAWTAADSAFIFDATLYFNYAEYPATDPGALATKTIKWPWIKGLRRESNSNVFNLEQDGIAFFELLKNNIPVDANFKRIFLGIDVEIIAGGEALEDYVNVGLANAGITASQELPTFSNLSEGKGVFSSINKFRRDGLGITATTRDSLKNGYLTKNLNF